MICLLFAVPDAQAGTYTWTGTDPTTGKPIQSPTFSGGQFYDEYEDPTGPYNYESSGNTTQTGNSSGQTSSSGTLSAVFTWQPAAGRTSTTDPAPQCILTQTSTADWYASGFSYKPATTCTDGLAAPADMEYDYSYGNTFEGRMSGTRYSVGVPMSGVVSTSLSGAAAAIDISDIMNGGLFPDIESGVQWTIGAFPVTINPFGATSDGNGGWDILVGQHFSPSLAGIPDALLNNTANPPVYQWSVSGTTFQN